MVLLLVALGGCGQIADFGTLEREAHTTIVRPGAPISPTGSVTNSVVITDITGLVTSTIDLYLTWTPPALAPDYYEVWHSNVPYFGPGRCVSCTLAVTTELTGTVVAAPNNTFNPCYGVEGCDVLSGFDFYIVRSRLPGGTARSTEIGVVTYSLNQGETEQFP